MENGEEALVGLRSGQVRSGRHEPEPSRHAGPERWLLTAPASLAPGRWPPSAAVVAVGPAVARTAEVAGILPTNHPAPVPGPGFLGADAQQALSDAGAILSLNWIDVCGTLRKAGITDDPHVVSVILDQLLAGGWSKEHQARVAPGVWLPSEPDTAVAALLEQLPAAPPQEFRAQPASTVPSESGPTTLGCLSETVQATLAGTDTTLVRLPLGWDGDTWASDHPLAFLGCDGGGVGSGSGMTVGAALARHDIAAHGGPKRLPVAVLGDDDFLMGVQAICTAAHEGLPALIVVANNRLYFNDEVHQEKVANVRDRDASRKWVGQRIADPAPDLVALPAFRARSASGPFPTAPTWQQRCETRLMPPVRKPSSWLMSLSRRATRPRCRVP